MHWRCRPPATLEALFRLLTFPPPKTTSSGSSAQSGEPITSLTAVPTFSGLASAFQQSRHSLQKVRLRYGGAKSMGSTIPSTTIAEPRPVPSPRRASCHACNFPSLHGRIIDYFNGTRERGFKIKASPSLSQVIGVSNGPIFQRLPRDNQSIPRYTSNPCKLLTQ